MTYLFHNIYGDCDHLLAQLPDHVIAVPFGWNAETEQARNQILQSIGESVSSLPSLVTQIDGQWVVFSFVASDHDWDSLQDLIAEAQAWEAARS
jgi:hypothetical protein